jgi:hypothetical protein
LSDETASILQFAREAVKSKSQSVASRQYEYSSALDK